MTIAMSKLLLYELTCPSCGHAAKLAFARVDAMSVCESCGHEYRVRSEYVRHFRVISGQEGESEEHLVQDQVQKQPQPAGPANGRAKARGSKRRRRSFLARVSAVLLTGSIGLLLGAWRLNHPADDGPGRRGEDIKPPMKATQQPPPSTTPCTTTAPRSAGTDHSLDRIVSVETSHDACCVSRLRIPGIPRSAE